MFYDVSSQKVTRGGHTRALDVDVTDILDVLRRLIPKGYKGGHTAAYDYMNKIIERFHTLIVKVVVSKNLYSCFDRLSDIVLYLT